MAVKYKLSPSKADRYLQCTASLLYDEAFVESPATIRGSQLHLLSEKMIQGLETERYIEEHEFNDYELNNIDAYVTEVYREADSIGTNNIIVERKVSVNLYGQKINMIIDVLILDDYVASIIDLKTGRGVVEVENNSQLYFYALHICFQYPKVEEIRVAIFQNFKAKRLVLTRDEVFDFFIGKETKFLEINEDRLTYSPSDSACKWCSYRKECKARAKWIIGGKDE